MFLRLEGIRKRLGNFSLSLNCSIRKGDFVTLLGPSGCGKTTVLNIVSGILNPDSGSVYLEGKDITELRIQDRQVGMVFQDYALFPHLSVGKNVGYGPRSRKLSRQEIKERITSYLDLVRLPNTEKRTISSLSGGEKQRIALARAMAAHPKLLLLDEPLSALDTKLRQYLREEIHRIQRETGITTIYVTHDQEEALTLSDRIILLSDGNLVQYGTPEDLYRNPVSPFAATFLGETNFFDGRIIGRTGDNLTVVRLSNQQVVTVETSCSVSEDVSVFFRPEDCIPVDKSFKTDGNYFRGKILRKEYRGSSSMLKVSWNGKQIDLLVFGRPMLYREGEAINFHIASGNIMLFPMSMLNKEG
jgi:ABC-type Fe3+/spermidine/putrescine transport system ATPase subunit